jgi:hypothetical protein
MPLKATEGLRGKELAKVQSALAEYVLAAAPILPMAREGRCAEVIHRAQPPRVPFEITMHKWPRSWHAAPFGIVQMLSGDKEAMRRARIERACKKKYPKLAAWQRKGARTIMVLEDNDVQVTSEASVADALLSAEKKSSVALPDEVYLVTTFSDIWHGHIIRTDNKTYFDFAYEDQSDRYWEINPATLIDALRPT